MLAETLPLAIDYSALSASIEGVLSLAVVAFVLVWFYRAVTRIEESLRKVNDRLDLLERGSNQSGTNPTPSPTQAKERGRISNMWGIPAILFIIAAMGGYPLLGWALTVYLFGAAGATAIIVVAWEVVRREI
jgi:hypothetical protein